MIPSGSRQHVFVDVAIAVVAAALLTSAISHLWRPYEFLMSVHRYRVLPPNWVAIAASSIPALHIFLACSLFFPGYRRFALLVSSCLFLIYAGLQLTALSRGLDISCGCFTIGAPEDQSRIGGVSLAIVFACLLLSGTSWRFTAEEAAVGIASEKET